MSVFMFEESNLNPAKLKLAVQSLVQYRDYRRYKKQIKLIGERKFHEKYLKDPFERIKGYKKIKEQRKLDKIKKNMIANYFLSKTKTTML